MSSDLKNNILNADTWLRLLFMVVFWFLLTFIGWWLFGVVVLIQFVVVLITGERNEQLTSFGSRLAVYYKGIVSYLCFCSDEKPFPFSDFPEEESTKE